MAAVLLPSFDRARGNARRSSCQTNLKQITLGFRQYVQDYDKKYPPTNNHNMGTGAGGWVDILLPYLKSTKYFQCPGEASGPPAGPASKGYTDYWMNGNVASKSQTAFTDPWKTLLMGDTDTSNFGQSDHCATYDGKLDGFSTKKKIYGSAITNWYTALGPGASAAQQNASSTKHLDGANYDFADGHVKWLKNDQPGNDTGKALASGSISFRVN